MLHQNTVATTDFTDVPVSLFSYLGIPTTTNFVYECVTSIATKHLIKSILAKFGTQDIWRKISIEFGREQNRFNGFKMTAVLNI